MLEKHLDLVQPEDFARPNAVTCTTAPAFLIHDGGGTVFAYHCLGALKRFVYGIQNPHFRTGEVFPGGLPEMGRLYAEWIRKAISEPDFPAPKNPDGSVDILVGGWSLGGMLSLEVLEELRDDPSIRIVGILMIDSIYPFKGDEPLPFDFSDPLDAIGGEGALETLRPRERNKFNSDRAMANARRMLLTWKIPPGSSSRSPSRPKMILIRVTKYIPPKEGRTSIVDTYREERTLGWDQYDEAMFEEVYNVEADHFDLFEDDKIDETTVVVKKALDHLSRLAHQAQGSSWVVSGRGFSDHLI